VVVIVLVVVLILTVGHRAQALTIPASVGGLPRIQGPAADRLTEPARSSIGPDLLAGAYGRGEPAFLLFLLRAHGEGFSGFEAAFVRGAAGVGLDPGAVHHISRDGVAYDCAAVVARLRFAFCFFEDGNALGAGMALGSAGIDRALDLTSQGRGAAESG
jgi:hypothetical protein